MSKSLLDQVFITILVTMWQIQCTIECITHISPAPQSLDPFRPKTPRSRLCLQSEKSRKGNGFVVLWSCSLMLNIANGFAKSDDTELNLNQGTICTLLTVLARMEAETLEYLGTLEFLYNPNFKVVEFDHFRIQARLPPLTLSVSEWIEKSSIPDP